MGSHYTGDTFILQQTDQTKSIMCIDKPHIKCSCRQSVQSGTLSSIIGY